MSNRLIKEGFLMKKGHVRHNWKTRWFRLSDLSLRYYKKKKDRVPQGRICLRNANLSINQSDHDSDSKREFVMEVITSDGIVYPIQAPSDEELKTWVRLILDVVERLNLDDQGGDGRSPKKMADGTQSSLGADNNDALTSLEFQRSADPEAVVLPCNLPPGEIVKQGILLKKGHIVPNWKARCFVLQKFPSSLSYFDPSKKNSKVLNTLTLRGATTFVVGRMPAQEVLRMRNPPEHLFCVKLSDGTLYLITASSDAERDEWIAAIKPMCRKSDS